MPWAFTAIVSLLTLNVSASEEIGMAGLHRVAYDDCGVSERQPHLVTGGMWHYPASDIPVDKVGVDDPARSVAHGERIVFRYNGLAPSAVYKLRVQYLSDCDTRVERVQAGDVVLRDRLALPRSAVLSETMELPRETYASGELTLTFAKLEGPNAVVSTIELWSSEMALPPIIRISLNSLRGDSLTGRVVDANTACGVEGAKISATVSGHTRSAHATSKEDGSFACTLPSLTRNNAGMTLTCSAAKAGLTASVQFPLGEITMDAARLTPPPAAIIGVATTRISLDGTWSFHPAPPRGFWAAPAVPADGWRPIEVPGEWSMQGFTVEKNAAAAYRREFTVPAEWLGRRIKMRFDAVSSRATVWVNGNPVGEHEGGFTPFEFDVTQFVHAGTPNTVALSVENDTLADELASGTQYAAHPLGGITRKACVFCTPEVNVASFRADTTFDAAYENATLKLGIEVANDGEHRARALSAAFTLRDPDGKDVTLPVDEVAFPAIAAGDSFKGAVDIPVTRPQKWDNEHPRLYTLSCTLRQNGLDTETVTRRIGFRQVEVRENQLLVNGCPVKLRGSCRHETHPVRGRSLTPELWRKDAELFRNANVNYIRTSHYPPAEEFIEACDELGLFVEEEAPVCWVGHAAGAGSRQSVASGAQIEALIVRQAQEMIRRDASHPSVVIWSLANESKWSPVFEDSLAYANEADPSRPKSFHDQAWGTFNNYGSAQTDIAVYHYPTPAETSKDDVRGRPMLFGEYSHLNVYNREELAADPGVRDAWGRGFADMWERMQTTKGCLGGALWAGMDDVFELPDGRAVGYGPWGFIDGWRREKPEYWHVKKVYSPVRVDETPLALPANGNPLQIPVSNRSDFSNLGEMRIVWTLQDGSLTPATGTLSGVDIPPGQSGELVINCSPGTNSPKAVRIDFHSPRGFLVDSFAVPFVLPTVAEPSPNPSKGILTTRLDEVVLASKSVSATVDKTKGQFRTVTKDGSLLLIGGPALMLLPLKGGICTTDYRADIQPFTDTCHNWVAGRVRLNATSVVVPGDYDEASGEFAVSLAGANALAVDYRFVVKHDINPRQTGLVFDLPREFDTLSWERKGQWSLYPDDHIGRTVGTAQAFAANVPVGEHGRTAPQAAWSIDATPMGSNDFRSTKENVSSASLTAKDGRRVTLQADHGGVRAWVDGDRIRVLVTGYSNAGGEGFSSSQTSVEWRPLHKGDVVEGRVLLGFESR